MAFTKVSSIGLQVTDGQTQSGLAASLTETSSGTDWQVRPYTATTSWTAVPLGSLASFDLIAIKNIDTSNYVQLAIDNAGAKIFAKLTAGRFIFLPLDPTATLYVLANTASVVIQMAAVEP